MGPLQQQRQCQHRKFSTLHHRLLPPRRHQTVASQPGTKHPRRRTLHTVHSLRLRCRRAGRNDAEDSTRLHRRTRSLRLSCCRRCHHQDHRQYCLLRQRRPNTQRTRIPHRVRRTDRRRTPYHLVQPKPSRQLRKSRRLPRHLLLLGRHQRQPRRPPPRRRGTPRQGRQNRKRHLLQRLLHTGIPLGCRL